MSKQSNEGSGYRLLDEGMGDATPDGGEVGLREGGDKGSQGEDSSTGDRRTKVGRSRDFSQIKKTRSIGITDEHYELWRKAAHPQSRSHWLASHLEENQAQIEERYQKKIMEDDNNG